MDNIKVETKEPIIEEYCLNCKKDIITKKWYQTKNLLYLCEECYNKLYN